MVNGDHGKSAAENSSESSSEIPEPTQGDLSDTDLCEHTQQDIASVKHATLQYMGSLLQQPNGTEIIKIPLPTTSNSEISVLFGRQSSGGPDHLIFVNLNDRSRTKQPSSSKHSLLRFQIDSEGSLSASLQDLHIYKNRHTVITESTGRVINLDTGNRVLLSNGCLLHFCPRVPRLPQEDQYEDYHAFKFSLNCDDLPASQCESQKLETSVESGNHHENQTRLHLVVASSFIGKLMGVGGSTIRSIRHDYINVPFMFPCTAFFTRTLLRNMEG